jgi:hypothetical protein
MDKATLLGMLQANRALFDQTLAQVKEPYLTGPHGADERSARDIVAHITGWEQRLRGWLAAAARGETPQIPEPGATWDDMDRLNARDFKANHHRPVDEVLADSRRSFQQLLERVVAFSEGELTEPGRYAWMNGEPLWRRITAGPGYGHYQAHLYDLLQRSDPDEWYIPDPGTLARYVGTFAAGDTTMKFRIEGDRLIMHRSWDECETPCIALDDTRFAYEHGGLVTFLVAEDGTVPSLEVWSYIHRRIVEG